MSRPNGRVAEVTQQVVRDHDPPVSAGAPSLSPHAEKSLAVRSRGGSDMRLGGRSAAMSKPPGGERKTGGLLDDERKSSLRFASTWKSGLQPTNRCGASGNVCVASNRGRVTMISLAQARVAALQRLALMREPLTIYPSASLECQANKLRAVTVMHLRRQLRAIGRSDCRASGAHRVRPQRETASSACLKSTNGFVRII